MFDCCVYVCLLLSAFLCLSVCLFIINFNSTNHNTILDIKVSILINVLF